MTAIDPRFGKLAARLLRACPDAAASQLLAQALNLMGWRGLIPLDDPMLQQRTFLVGVRDAGLVLSLRHDGSTFRACPRLAAPDFFLHADLADHLALLWRQEDPDTLFFQRRIDIGGDTELGLWVKNVLDSIDWRSQLKLY
ncbi:SCP2 domain-containing protein [Vogesella sp. XCS3]|jgi:predicted lipid carrier protein YhbT|nr:SCP2 sterol-binding domain-containing protein [Vogesella sp.]